MRTLVLQSHRQPLPHEWLQSCLDSVQRWSALHNYEYRFLDNALFDSIPEAILQKTQKQKVIATDLARLHAIRAALVEGYETVVWLDADFCIFNPQRFVLPEEDHAVGREVWVQADARGNLKVYKKVHNAFLMFRRDNAFLEFYLDSALRLVSRNSGGMPDQFIGPKLLTALHNVVGLPVMETAGMLSPPVIKNLVDGGGAALELFLQRSPAQIAGANLCTSSVNKGDVTSKQMAAAIDSLADLFNRQSHLGGSSHIHN